MPHTETPPQRVAAGSPDSPGSPAQTATNAGDDPHPRETRSSIRAPRDFGAGLLFLAFASAGLALASDYPLGSARRMGPGYFPAGLSLALGGIGAGLMVRSFFRDGDPIGRIAWLPLLQICGATVLFGAVLRGAGVPLAVAALVLISASASRQFRWPAAIALAAGLALFCALLFVQALGLPLPLLGRWLGG